MEEDKIRDLFKEFDPDLPSDSLFMSRLKRNMESVEMVKRHTEEAHRRSRIALYIAATVGFIVGSVFSFFIPLLASWVSSIKISVPYLSIVPIEFDPQFLLWPLAGIAASVSAYQSYTAILERSRK